MTTVEGIVLKERIVGETGKFIDVLTTDFGVIELTAKGARKVNGSIGSAVQLFAYSKFCFSEHRKYLIVNSAEPIRIFYGLRESLTRISLASYFSDVIKFCIGSEKQPESIMRLALNTLHYLEKGLREESMLKSIFELRLMSETGFMPDVLACRNCGGYEPEKIFFSIREGCFFCGDCYCGDGTGGRFISPAVLSAVRHIVLSDFERLYNFKVSQESMGVLSKLSEEYLLSRTERNFRTLDFYKCIKS